MKRTIYHQLWVLSPPPPVTWNRRDYYLSCRLFFLNSFALFILSLAFFYPRHPLILYWSHISNFYQSSDCARKHGRGSQCLPPHSIFLTKDRRWNNSVQCTVHAHCPSSLGTLREHSEKIQRSRRDQLETIRRLLRNHSENMKRRLRKCPFTGGAKPGPQTCFAFLNPQRKKSERYDERLRQFWNAWRWQGVVTALVCGRLRPESRRGTPATTLASTSLKIMRQKFKKIHDEKIKTLKM